MEHLEILVVVASGLIASCLTGRRLYQATNRWVEIYVGNQRVALNPHPTESDVAKLVEVVKNDMPREKNARRRSRTGQKTSASV
jgi:hypothetical protein